MFKYIKIINKPYLSFIRHCSVLLFLFSSSQLMAAATEPFQCDGRFYQNIRTGNVNYIYEVETSPVNFQLLTNLSAQGLTTSNANALAYNPTDNFLYISARRDTGDGEGNVLRIYKIDKNGSLEEVGIPKVSGVAIGATVNSGVISFAGLYFITSGTGGPMYAVDLDTMVATNLGSYTGTIPDIAIHPVSGLIYGWNQTGRILSRIDLDDINNPTAITATVNIGTGDSQYGTMGAAYFTATGELIAYGDDSDNTATSQETLVSIDISTGVVTPLGTGDEASANDGASCPYYVNIKKTVSSGTVSLGSVITYTFEIENASSATLSNITFSDTLVDGHLWDSEPYNLSTGLTISSSSINGTADGSFVIDSIPTGTSTFDIDVQVPTAVTSAEYLNTAYLNNLPIALGGVASSDDGNTSELGDSTNHVINTPELLLEQSVVFATGGDTDLSGTFTAGDVLEYTITLTNTGGVDANTTTVTNVVPAALSYSAASITGADTRSDVDPSGAGLSWNIATVAASGGQVSMTYQAVIQSGFIGVLNVQAEASGTNISGSLLSDAADVSALQSVSLITDADASGNFSAGDLVQFDVLLTNTGTMSADNLQINSTVDSQLSYASISISGGDSRDDTDPYDATAGVPNGLVWAVDSLGLGGGNAQTLSYQATIGNDVANTAGVVSSATLLSLSDMQFVDQAEPTPVLVTVPPAVTLTKTVASVSDADSSGSVTPGDTLRYTLTISASGNTANVLSVFDAIPTGLTYVAGSISTTDSNSEDDTDPANMTPGLPLGLTWGINSLTAGSSATLTFDVTVGTINGTVLSNQAYATGNFVGLLPSDDPSVGGTVDATLITIDDLPLAVDDFAVTSVGTNLTIDALINDTDQGDGLASITLPSATTLLGGSVVITDPSTPGDPTDDLITYTPPGSTGADSFDYTITDTDGDTSTATVYVSVDSPNMQIDIALDAALIPTGLVTDADASTDITETDVIRMVATVTNGVGGQTANTINLLDVLPAGYGSVSNVSIATTGTVGTITDNSVAGQLDIDIASMAAESSVVVHYDVTVATSTAATTVSNTPQISGANFLTISETLATYINELPPSPDYDVSVTLTDGQATYTPGVPLVYTLVVANAGPASSDSVTISLAEPSDALITSWSCVAANGATCPNASGTGSISEINSSLPDGSSLTYTVNITPLASRTGNLVVSASNTAGANDTNAGNDTVSDTDTLAASANINVSLDDGQTTYVPGNNVNYTLLVTNTGPSDSQGVNISYNAATESSISAWSCTASGGASCPNASGTGNINENYSGGFPAGASLSYAITLAVASSKTGNLVTTAAASGTTTDPDNTNDSTTQTETQSSLADVSLIIADGTSTYTPGSPLVYSFTMSNAGPSDASDPSFVVNAPSGSSITGWTCAAFNGMSCPNASGTGNISESAVGAFIVGSSAVFTVTLAPDSNRSGDLIVSGSLTTTSSDPNASNNTPSDTNTISLNSDLSVTIDDATGSYTPGTSTVYTVTVLNNGPSDSSGASFTLLTPGVGANSQTWTCSGNGCSGASGSGDISAVTLGSMASGQSAVYSVTLTIDAGQTGNLVATSTVSLAADGNAANDSATDTNSISSSSDISISITDGDTSYVPGSGEIKTYSVSVTNNGPSSASNVSVTMTAPGANTIGSWSCTNCAGNSGTGNIADTITTLGSGVTAVYSVPMTVNVATTGNLLVTASATVAGDPDNSNDTATDTDVESTSADVNLSLTDSSSSYTAGTTSVYTLVMSNSGPSTASNSALTMNAPAGTSITSWTCSGADCPAASGSGNISETVTTLVSAASVTYTINLAINSNTTGNLISSATVSSATSDPDASNNTVTDTNTESASSNLSVTLDDGQSTYVPGSSAVYTLTVTNNGPSDASNVLVSMTKPGVSANTISWSCTNCGGGSGSSDISHTIASLASGSSAVYTVTLGIDATQTGNLIASATVSADQSDADTSNNSATDIDALVANADLQLSLTNGQTQYIPGNNFSYTYTITNNGPDAAVNVTATFVYQAGTTISNWSCAGSGGVVCPNPTGTGSESNQIFATFPSGGQAVYTINMIVPLTQTGNLSATGNVTSTTVDLVAGNNSATDTDTISAQSDLSATLTDSDTDYIAGDIQTYLFTVSNAGPDTAADASIVMADPGFNSMSWICAANGGATCPTASGSGAINETANATDLPSGGSLVYTVTANTTGMSGDVVTTASVTTSNGFDSLSGNNSASDTNTEDSGAPTISIGSNGDNGDGRYNSLEAEAIVVSGSTSYVSNAETVTVRFDDGTNPVVTTTATVAANSWTAIAADISDLNQATITVTADVSEGVTAAPTASASVIYLIDQDADGIPDTLEGITDRDGDGNINALDLDADNDGIPDFLEGESTGTDTDNDKLDDRYDVNQTAGTDANIDGLDDNVSAPDTDNDAVPDFLDLDADNDGMSDTLESGASSNDTDLDGIDDLFDVDQTGGTDADSNGIDDNVIGTDTDNDGIPNYKDLDSDNDGIPDRIENGSIGSDSDNDGIDDAFDVDETGGTDANNDGMDDNNGPTDTDGDGTPDYLETDSDNDGILDATEGDVTGTDTDSDGIDDAYDVDQAGGPDVDGDGIKDDAATDTDADGTPDYKDLDSDDDGITDAIEGETNTDGTGEANYRDTDSDDDGISDAIEGTGDPDGDTLGNYIDPDSDGDGTSDLIEGAVDSDGDGIPNYLDTSADEDNDGWPDFIEGNADRDGDGINDALDPDADNDGVPDRFENGSSGIDTDSDGIDDVFDVDQTGGTDANLDGIDDAITPTDSDADGVYDYLDMDSDNDGISDRIEATQPIVQNLSGSDADNDGIDDVFDVDATGGSDANNDGFDDAYQAVDTDNDGTIDMLDSDSDNDGIPDNIEASNTVALNSDIDNDGTDDAFDPDQTGGTDANGDSIDDAVVTAGDVDNDGLPNFRDIDSDGDGIFDSLEYGDFNNDGILDPYQQDPGLETAISGSGSLGGWSLIVFFALLLLRQYFKRALLMMCLLMVSSVISAEIAEGSCATLISSSGSNSETQKNDADFKDCWYLGGGIGVSTLEPDDSNSSWEVSDTGSSGFQLHVGYHFKPDWFAEFVYADIGEAGVKHRNPLFAQTGNISYKVPSFFLGYQFFEPDDRWNLYAKMGLSFIQNKTSNSLVPFEEQTSEQVSVGLGIKWRFNNHWFARIEIDSYDEDANFINVSLSRYLGGQPKEKIVETVAETEQEVPVEKTRTVKTCNKFNGYLERVHFKPDSYDIEKDVLGDLAVSMLILQTYGDLKFEIRAYTDSDGGYISNLTLSQNRAQAIVDYFISKGIDPARLTAKGYGENHLIYNDDLTENKSRSRRVEMIPKQQSACSNITESELNDLPSQVCHSVSASLQGLRFTPGSTDFINNSTEILNNALLLFDKYRMLKFEIATYTNSDGSSEDNRVLSHKRASAVMKYFVKNGIDAEQLTARGYGEENPVLNPDKTENKLKSERVELHPLESNICGKVTREINIYQ